VRRALGDHVGLPFRGQPDAVVTGRHVGAAPHHSSEDELVYILEGETALRPGMCAGFKAGSAMRLI